MRTVPTMQHLQVISTALFVGLIITQLDTSHKGQASLVKRMVRMQ